MASKSQLKTVRVNSRLRGRSEILQQLTFLEKVGQTVDYGFKSWPDCRLPRFSSNECRLLKKKSCNSRFMTKSLLSTWRLDNINNDNINNDNINNDRLNLRHWCINTRSLSLRSRHLKPHVTFFFCVMFFFTTWCFSWFRVPPDCFLLLTNCFLLPPYCYFCHLALFFNA
jgi:hypothetical protein